MLEIVQKQLNIHLEKVNNPNLLLACSGGVDSMVLFELLHKLNYKFAVAHCNFQLRGEESDEDENFVAQHCKKYGIPFFSRLFATAAFAEDHSISIQMAARELRYAWFSELMEKHSFSNLLTAHHLNDQVESFLINLSRASGLKGLAGIPTQKVLRPLLGVHKSEILHYAQEAAINWREDASNATDAYLRNKLRHHLLPAWEKISPTVTAQINQSIEKLSWAQLALAHQLEEFKAQHFQITANCIEIPLKPLIALQPQEYYLHALFSPFGFHHLNDLMELTQAQSGKQLHSKSHRLIRNRDYFLLQPLLEKNETDATTHYWEVEEDLVHPIVLKLSTASSQSKQNAVLDRSLLKFPLILRKYREGDYFYPVGMQGKKKLSKFFKDQKYSLLEKEQQWLLCSEDNIVWVIGQRVDARYAAKKDTNNPLKIQCT